MRVLITGSQGRVAGGIITALADSHKLRLSHYKEPEKRCGHEFVKMDISKYNEVENAVKGVDVIVHLATKGSKAPGKLGIEETISINVEGTANLLEASVKHNIKKFIYVSSVCIYGLSFINKIAPQHFPIDEEHPLVPEDYYGLSKLLSEELCGYYSRRYNLSTIALRIGRVILPDKPYNYKEVLRRGEEKEDPIITFWNHIDVRDVAQAVSLSIESKLEGFHAFNITAEDHLFDTKARTLINRYYPEVKIRNNGFREQGTFFDINKAKSLLGFNPKFSYHGYKEWMKTGKSEEDYYLEH